MITRSLLIALTALCSNALRPAVRRRRATAMRGSSSDVWQAMKVIDLKAACRRRGLKVSGTKAELVARLVDASHLTARTPCACAATAARAGAASRTLRSQTNSAPRS